MSCVQLSGQEVLTHVNKMWNEEMVGEVWLEYGTFLTNVIDFIIVAFVMFMVVKGVNKMKKKEEPAPEAPKGPSEIDLLIEIRDSLKK